MKLTLIALTISSASHSFLIWMLSVYRVSDLLSVEWTFKRYIFLLALIVSIIYVKILFCSNLYRLENWFWMRAILKTGGFSNISYATLSSCWIVITVILSLIAMKNCYLIFLLILLKIYLVQYRKELMFKNELWTHCIKLHKSRSLSLF